MKYVILFIVLAILSIILSDKFGHELTILITSIILLLVFCVDIENIKSK